MPSRRHAIAWTNGDPFHRRILAALGWGWVIGIDTKIEVIVVSFPGRWWHALGLWWASQVVGDTTMTEIEVSISILSWFLKAYYNMVGEAVAILQIKVQFRGPEFFLGFFRLFNEMIQEKMT